MRRKYDFRKVDVTLWHECFREDCFDIFITCNFLLKFYQKGLHGQKSAEWKTASLENYLNIYLAKFFIQEKY